MALTRLPGACLLIWSFGLRVFSRTVTTIENHNNADVTMFDKKSNLETNVSGIGFLKDLDGIKDI